MPRIKLERKFDEPSGNNPSARATHEKFERALWEVATNIPHFNWKAKNVHLRTANIEVSDEVSITVVYDEDYYRGPQEPRMKKRAIEETAKVIAVVYARTDDHLEEISSVNVTMVPTNGNGDTPNIFYSLKP